MRTRGSRGRRCVRRHPARGYSLLELSIVLGISAVLVGLGVLLYGGMRRDAGDRRLVETAAFELQTALGRGQQQARRGQSGTVPLAFPDMCVIGAPAEVKFQSPDGRLSSTSPLLFHFGKGKYWYRVKIYLDGYTQCIPVPPPAEAVGFSHSDGRNAAPR